MQSYNFFGHYCPIEGSTGRFYRKIIAYFSNNS